MNHLDFDRHLMRRDEEILREVRENRLKERLRSNRTPRPKGARSGVSWWRRVFSLLRGGRISEQPLGQGRETR